MKVKNILRTMTVIVVMLAVSGVNAQAQDVSVEITNTSKFYMTMSKWVFKDGTYKEFVPGNPGRYVKSEGKNQWDLSLEEAGNVAYIEFSVSGEESNMLKFPLTLPTKKGSSARFVISATDKENVKFAVNTKTPEPPAVEKKVEQKKVEERRIGLRNDLYDVFIAKVYARAAGTKNWGNYVFIGNIAARTSAVNIRIPLSISKNFDLRIVTSNAKEYIISNCRADRDNVEFTVR